MTNVKNAPNQPFMNTKGQWNWEDEDTLVDRHNRLSNRVSRFLRSGWIWKTVLTIFIIGLVVPSVMRLLLTVLGVTLSVGIFMMTIVLQFVAIFWFLSKSRTYEIMPGTEGVSFADYKGQPELLEQARQVVTLLRGVKTFEDAGGEPLTGVLLEGPPGTGKTWLAKAISTEAGVPFYYVDTSSLQGMFMGTSSLKVINMFGKARKAAKMYGAAVIFLDEIDTVGSRGGVSSTGGRGPGGGNPMGGMGGEMGLLSTLLVQMDGFSSEHGWRASLRARFYKLVLHRKVPKPERRVLVIGATNRVSSLDPALLRPGRFDKKLRVDPPDMQGRVEIFAYYLLKMAHDDTMVPAILATETPGYTPADIKYLLNESLRYALFAGRAYITYEDFRMAQPEHEMGIRSPIKNMSPEAKRRLAYHEAGHALAVRLFMPHHRIARITIIRQGEFFGHVSHYPAQDVYQGMQTITKLENRMKVSVAGKAGEVEFCGLNEQTVGVYSDFNTIRGILWQMAMAGMLGPLGGALGRAQDITITGEGGTSAPSPEMAKAMEEEFQKIFTECRTAMRERKDIMDALVNLLLEKNEILSDEIRAFFDRYGLHTPDPTLLDAGDAINILPPEIGEIPVAVTDGRQN
ncbi:MAG: AAA family ATPase [Anaerolineae bacterium]|nr:AAA family ATPase [Anaerolineae bacterium]